MKNYIDFEWEAGRRYRLFTFRRFLADLYNLKIPSVYPLDYKFDGMTVIREVAVGSATVEFDSLQNYLTAMRSICRGKYATLVREEEYDKFVKQYASVIELTNASERIYVEPRTCYYFVGSGYQLHMNIHYVDGGYTTFSLDVNDLTPDEREDKFAIRDKWLMEQDSTFDYCKRQTQTIDKILKHFTDLSNTWEGEYRLFELAIKNNLDKGFDMCVYKVNFLDESVDYKTFAKRPEDILNGIPEEHKDKVYSITTIGYCSDDMEQGISYKIVLNRGRFIPFLYRDRKSFSKLISPIINRGEVFRIEEE